MKFVGVLLVYLCFAILLGAGILRTITGHPALLITGVAVYVILLAKIGCLPAKVH